MLFIFGIAVLYELMIYFHFYYAHYPQTNISDWGGEFKQVVLKTGRLQGEYKRIVVDYNLGTGTLAYFKYYNNTLKPIFVDSSWQKPADWNYPILYVHPDYGKNNPGKFIYNVFLENRNNDIFAQFWEI